MLDNYLLLQRQWDWFQISDWWISHRPCPSLDHTMEVVRSPAIHSPPRKIVKIQERKKNQKKFKTCSSSCTVGASEHLEHMLHKNDDLKNLTTTTLVWKITCGWKVIFGFDSLCTSVLHAVTDLLCFLFLFFNFQFSILPSNKNDSDHNKNAFFFYPFGFSFIYKDPNVNNHPFVLREIVHQNF